METATKDTPSFDFMFGRLRDFINRHIEIEGDPIPPTRAALMLLSFIKTHGDESLTKMYGFLRYAETRQKPIRDIILTITHDINGRDDKFMLPKTDGYGEFASS